MTEQEYIAVGNLTKLRIAYSVLSDVLTESVEVALILKKLREDITELEEHMETSDDG